jgi:hypothetical protein
VAAKDITSGALKQMADSSAQLDKPWRDFLVQSRFVIHRRQQPDRHHHIGLVLRRPQRDRETVDMRAP